MDEAQRDRLRLLTSIKGEPVWGTLLDKRYLCTVTRLRPYTGSLEIRDTQTKLVVHQRPVGLSYDALFGPDIGDVQEWQGMCTDFVDSLPKEPPT